MYRFENVKLAKTSEINRSAKKVFYSNFLILKKNKIVDFSGWQACR